jgi:hypothetical protein
MLPPVHLHAPLTHCWPPEQAIAQALQLFGSDCKLTHEPPQLVRPVPQVVWQVLVEQTCPLAHLFPHEPQLFTSDVVSTHAPLQLTPVAQPPSANMPASLGVLPLFPGVTTTPPLLLPEEPLLPVLPTLPLELPLNGEVPSNGCPSGSVTAPSWLMIKTWPSGKSAAPSGRSTAASRGGKTSPSGSCTAPSFRTIDPLGSLAGPLSGKDESNDPANDESNEASKVAASLPPPQATSKTPKAGAMDRAKANAKKRFAVFMISHDRGFVDAARVRAD